MSRRGNAVRGPTSALTEYLRSTGITPTSVAQRVATRNAEAGPSTAVHDDGDSQPEESASLHQNRRRESVTGYTSDNLDEPESPAKKRKASKIADARNKPQKKKKKDNASDGDDDTYTALSAMTYANSSDRKPSNGSIIDCAQCGKPFTVTQYTRAANPGPGWLCHICLKASGVDPFKKPAAPRKRKTAADKRPAIEVAPRLFPSLVSLCVRIVSEHIDEVEALGDIGAVNLQEIAKAIAKNRSLTTSNVKLFYNATQPQLVLYDATNLPPPAYETLVMLNPCLTSLRLDFCGRMNSEALDCISSGLPQLTHLELLGPFLVKSESWQKFLRGRSLVSFKITQSPRFDLDCLTELLEASSNTLEELRLTEVGKLDDDFLIALQRLGSPPSTDLSHNKARPSKLRYLDLSSPSDCPSAGALVDLLAHTGGTLRHLDLSGHDEISDSVFAEGIQLYCHNLESLVVTNVSDSVTDIGISEFFINWQNPPLINVNLSRNPELGTKALTALLTHSGANLEHLNINGWKSTSLEALLSIPQHARELRQVDIGWCREVDDYVLQEMISGNVEEHRSGLPFLNAIYMFGCGRVNGSFHRSKKVLVHGLERCRA